MRNLILVGAAVTLILGAWQFAQSQTATVVALVLTTCGSPPAAFVAGRSAPLTVDTNGQVCN